MLIICSQVIHVARIRHLLYIDPEGPVVACVKFDDAVFDHILQVGKASPNVPLVLHGVCSGARVPVPKRRGRIRQLLFSTRKVIYTMLVILFPTAVSIHTTEIRKHPHAKVSGATQSS